MWESGGGWRVLVDEGESEVTVKLFGNLLSNKPNASSSKATSHHDGQQQQPPPNWDQSDTQYIRIP
jgi:hypothetical protein